MGAATGLITAYLLFPEAPSTNITEVDICWYHMEIEAPFGYRNHPGIVFRSRILLFSLSCCQLGFGGLLSLMSINSTAALSPPRAALPSQCPTPSSFPSVCTDPRGPRLPPRARHGPTSINISAGLHWWAERAVQNGPEPSDIFWEGSGNRGRNSDGKWVLNDYQLFCMF